MTDPTSTLSPVDDSVDAYRFTPSELARLAVYRAAIAAGFYTDTIADTDLVTDPESEYWTALPPEAQDSGLVGFTRAEVARLVLFKCAVAAGLYGDWLDEGGIA